MGKKLIGIILAALMAVTLLAGCGGANYMKSADSALNESYYEATSPAIDAAKKNGYGGDFDYVARDDGEWEFENDYDPGYDEEGGERPDAFLVDRTQKLVYTCDLRMETTEFEKSIDTVNELVIRYKGFIESETRSDNANTWYRSDYRKTSGTLSAYITIRIPTESYSSFLKDLEGSGRIREKNSSVENITRAYTDTETTIKALKTQEERLLEMLENCETVEDMITVEARLTEVQTNLQIYQSRLSMMDTDVAYSTIDLTLTEVLEYTEASEPVYTATFWNRLKNTLKESWNNLLDFLEDFLFFLIRVTPILLVLGLIGGIIAFIIVRSSKRRKARRAKKQAARALPNSPVQPIQPVQPVQRTPEVIVPEVPKQNDAKAKESRQSADEK